MMIEQNTNYAYNLKYMYNPTFDKVRDLATKFYRELPKELQDELYEALNRGVDILDSEPQMTTYLYAFGKMHQAKLEYAFCQLPYEFLELPEINIIDYGCGQALGTMCYADFLCEQGYLQKVKTITLIEPSEVCLKRAVFYVSIFFPDAEIITVNKKFDDLTQDDIVCSEETPTLHIFSNVLDMLCFDIIKFSALVKESLKGYNQFVCVGPYFNYSDKDNRMERFYSFLNGEKQYYDFFNKYEFEVDESWTAQILHFSVIIEDGNHDFLTKVTKVDLYEGVEDEHEVLYSKDGKRLLVSENTGLEFYNIKQGTITICDNAFCGCETLKLIDIPNTVTIIGDKAFALCKSIQKITIPNSVTNLKGDKNFFRCKALRQITLPDSITAIAYQTFVGCESLQHVKIPNSVMYISGLALAKCVSLRQINIPNSVIRIGFQAFAGCKSLQRINIPESVKYVGAGAFGGCKSLQQIIISKGNTERFMKMLDKELWDKLVEQ